MRYWIQLYCNPRIDSSLCAVSQRLPKRTAKTDTTPDTIVICATVPADSAPVPSDTGAGADADDVVGVTTWDSVMVGSYTKYFPVPKDAVSNK